MRYHLLFVSIVILGSCVTSAAMAGEGRDNDHNDNEQAFVGLWQAIDSYDGSTQLLSVTCSHRNACDVRLNDTLFTDSCSNEMGFAQGVGSIRHDVLTVNLTLFCQPFSQGSDGDLQQVNYFELDSRNGTLTNKNSDDLKFPNVFHKISK